MTENEAKKLIKKFTGQNAKKTIEIDLDSMKVLTVLGVVERIDYVAIKPKFGDKGKTLYYHVFDKPPMLLTNGKDLLIVGNIKITKRGIEG